MISIKILWRRITSIFGGRARTTPRVRELEAQLVRERGEIARLRAENRALLNSILGIAGIPPVLVDTPPLDFAALPSSVSLPAKCHSESAAADDESRSTPSRHSSTAAEKNSPGPQRPRNDIPPNPSPESSSLRSPAPSPSSVEGQGFSPDITTRAERACDLPGSSAKTKGGRPGSPSSLPKAVAESGRTQRQAFSPRQPPRRLATPLRRRSWHQIMRTLEFESGKKPSPSE